MQSTQATSNDAAPTASVSPEPSDRVSVSETAAGVASAHVVVSSTPACPPEHADGAPRASAASAKGPSFLADATIQQRVQLLASELAAAGDPQLGTYSDPIARTAVVVFPQEFTGYRAIQERLAARVPPLRVVLRPACYPRAKLEEARRLIAELLWHPRAKQVPIASHFEPSVSGYIVTVDDSAPEVASALAQRLGPLVRVRLGKPRRDGAAQ